MSTGQLNPVIRLMRQSAPREQGDADLLARFVRHGDESAFAALLERHGRMVLGLCRRVLGDVHEAEDAFQATFLLLVRKAGSLSRPAALGPWLHGVAYRTALKARAGAARRRGRPVQEHDRVAADPTDELVWRDLRPLLDEAIHGLPPKYRVPFVLCYLEGKSNAQAAEEIGCPRGTIATRLSRARDRLRSHLSRRGLTLSAAVLTTVLGRAAAVGESVPAPLSRSTVQAVRGTVPLTLPVLTLTKGVAVVMFMERMKLILVALLIVAAVGASAASRLLAGRATAAPPAVTYPVPVPAKEDDPPAKSATHRTVNFAVQAPTERIARLIGQAAERHRKRLARLWLGKEIPPWKKPCPIKITITTTGLGGTTSFAFDKGKILSQDMHLEGSLDGILANSLPHEVTHTILAHHFRCPIPRWADEGAALQSEDEREKKRYDKLLQEIFRKGRTIALRRLLPLKNYPPDVMVLYAQGYSLTRFLVEAGDRATYLAFVKDGMKKDWDAAVKKHYGYDSVDNLERVWRTKVSRLPPPSKPVAGPTPSLPPGSQPVIGIACQQGEQIVLRNSVMAYETRQSMRKIPGEKREQPVTYYVPVRRSQDIFCALKDVEVFGTDGKKVNRKEVARLLAKDRPVLVSADGRTVDPRYLKVVKEGTLILVLSQAKVTQPAPTFIPLAPAVSGTAGPDTPAAPPQSGYTPRDGSPQR